MTDVRVHLATPLADEQLQQIQAVSARLRLSYRPATPYVRPTELGPELHDAEVIIGYPANFEMAQAPGLRQRLDGRGLAPPPATRCVHRPINGRKRFSDCAASACHR